MESLRAFAKSSLEFINQTSDSILSNDTTDSNYFDSDEGSESNSLTESVDHDEKLFRSLNIFMTMLNKRNREFFDYQNQIQSNGYTGSPSSAIIISNKALLDYIRLNLIGHLRRCKRSLSVNGEERDNLNYWWITLLNILNSDLTSIEVIKNDATFYIDPQMVDLNLMVALLEAISRIMSILMVTPRHTHDELKSYSDNILTTTRYIAEQLVNNSKILKKLSSLNITVDIQTKKKRISFVNRSNSIIRSFLGKLIAFSYIYLPDSIQFDYHLLLTLSQTSFRVMQNKDSVFPWKRRGYKLTKQRMTELKRERLRKTIEGDESMSFLKIVISYIRNDSIFTSFYWYYWDITLRLLESSNRSLDFKSTNDLISLLGCEILMDHAVVDSLKSDLTRLNQLIRSINKPSITNEASLSDLDNVIAQDENGNRNSPKNSRNALTVDRYNNYLQSNCRIIKIWDCLWSLSNCFYDNSTMTSFLAFHDKSQLKYIQTISAYEHFYAGVIYNKIFYRLVMKFKNLGFIEWKTWLNGIISLLKTLNMSCQTTGLVCIFNIWPRIPTEHQIAFAREVIKKEIFDFLTVNTSSSLILILYLKFLVFRLSSLEDIRQTIVDTLQKYYLRSKILREALGSARIQQDTIPMLFNGNKKFVISVNRKIKASVHESKLNWMFGPLDSNWEENSIPELSYCPPLKNGKGPTFRVMIVIKSNKSIDRQNEAWSKSSRERRSREKTLPKTPENKLDLSLFEGCDLNEDIVVNKAINFTSRSEQEKIAKFFRVFNLTVSEYYDFQNLVNNKTIDIDYDVLT